MATPSKTLSALLSNTTITDHEEILRTCTTALKISKTDFEAQHVRFVALLKLDRYDDALRVLEEAGSALKEKAKLERAYALYKTGELEEAKKIARQVGGERGARHVEAQASYRSEDFASATGIYRQLQDPDDTVPVGDEESDLRINSGATDAQLAWKSQGGLVLRKSHRREDLEAFETAYNAACGSIARGELSKGEFLLNTAKGLCASLDELTEAEKTAEILPIQVQQLYVLGKLGKTAEAEKLASEIAIQDIPDASTRQVAQNNLLASTSHSANPYLSHRLLHDSPSLPKTDTLFTHQASLIQHNILTLDLLASKSSAVIKFTSRALSASPSPTTDPHINALSVLNAAAHGQSQLAKLGLKSILPLFVKRPTDIGLAMTIIQLYMLTSNLGAATAVLESLLKNISSSGPSNDDVLYAPGLVALQVSLYSLQNRRSAVTTVLAKAASYWRHRSKPQELQATSLLQAAGLDLLQSRKPEHQTEALEIFTFLHKSNPDSNFAKAGFMAASAFSSPSPTPSLVKEANQTLPLLSRQIQGLDIDALEAAGVPSLPSVIPAASFAQGKKKRKADAGEKPTKKRVRMNKRPKDFVEGKVMDPERWLPLRERSSYRPKGKKGRKRAGEQTQGGLVEKGGGEGKKPETTARIVAAPSGGAGGGGGGGKGKGKKKGKK